MVSGRWRSGLATCMPFMIALSQLIFAEKCDDNREDFLDGTFQVFNSRCPDGDLFYIFRYAESAIPRPDGRNESEYFATTLPGRHCMRNRNQIEVSAGTLIKLQIFKTPGEAICSVNIFNQSGESIVDDRQLSINDDQWNMVAYEMGSDGNITLELTCDVLDSFSTVVAIDNILLTRLCPLAPCDDVNEDFEDGIFNNYRRTCVDDVDMRFDVVPYANLTNVPEPENSSGRYYAIGRGYYACMRISRPLAVTNGTRLKLRIYKHNDPGVVVCFVNTLYGDNEYLTTTRVDIVPREWRETVVVWDRNADVITYEIDCTMGNDPEYAIDYIEITDRCSSTP